MRLLKKNNGESLIELLVSIAILSVVIVVFLRAITTLVTINNTANRKLNANYMAERLTEYLNSVSDIPFTTFEKKITETTDFTCTETSSSNPYKFKITYDEFSNLYATIKIEYKYYATNGSVNYGNMSRVTVIVYDNDDSEITTYESALYWE